jgi:glyoxylase-like metal-dependent hydrolase (beta-lactamase superfamily II)
MDVTVLCDAVAVFPEPVGDALPGWGDEHRDWTGNQAPGNVAPDGGWWLHFHSYLLTDETTATLVDTGIGPAGGAAAEWLGTSGRLPDLLDTAGVKPGEIGTVVLTHVHLDHAGWNTDGTLPRFPNASYVVQAAEVEHIRGGASYERYLKTVDEAGQLRTVDGETELDPGVRLVPTPGHTPGHQSVVTPRAVLAGDVLVHPAQAEWPELTYVYETEPEVAVTSRREVLAMAGAYGVPLAPAHLHTPLRVSFGLPGPTPLPAPGPGTERCPMQRL